MDCGFQKETINPDNEHLLQIQQKLSLRKVPPPDISIFHEYSPTQYQASYPFTCGEEMEENQRQHIKSLYCEICAEANELIVVLISTNSEPNSITPGCKAKWGNYGAQRFMNMLELIETQFHIDSRLLIQLLLISSFATTLSDEPAYQIGLEVDQLKNKLKSVILNKLPQIKLDECVTLVEVILTYITVDQFLVSPNSATYMQKYYQIKSSTIKRLTLLKGYQLIGSKIIVVNAVQLFIFRSLALSGNLLALTQAISLYQSKNPELIPQIILYFFISCFGTVFSLSSLSQINEVKQHEICHFLQQLTPTKRGILKLEPKQ